jgi:hypothetical protein
VAQDRLDNIQTDAISKEFCGSRGSEGVAPKVSPNTGVVDATPDHCPEIGVV